jgi:hypothetical protein
MDFSASLGTLEMQFLVRAILVRANARNFAILLRNRLSSRKINCPSSLMAHAVMIELGLVGPESRLSIRSQALGLERD